MTGHFLDIVEIVAPDSAVAGTRVNIIVNIMNIWPFSMRIRVAGVLEEMGILVDYLSWSSPVEARVDSLRTHSFEGYATMPDKDVQIRAYGYYYSIEDTWIQDDMLTKDLNLDILPPEFNNLVISDYRRK